MITTTWTNTAAAWSDPGAFTPRDPGAGDVALFWRDLFPETVAGNGSVGQVVVGLDDVTFTGTVEMSHHGLLVDYLGIARFAGGGGFDTAGLVSVGAMSSGTLILDGSQGENSAPMSAGEVVLGKFAGGDGSVDLTDAYLSVAHFMVIGGAGLGAVTVRGALSIGSEGQGDLVIGRGPSGSGILTVVGATSNVFVGGTIRVGQQGNAQLIVSSGATVFTDHLLAGSGGAITLAEGQVEVSGTATLAAGSTVFGDGVFSAGSIVDDGAITAHGSLAVDGAITGTGTLGIGHASSITLTQPVLGLSDIAFEGQHGTLILDGAHGTPPTVAAPISGFAVGDIVLMQSAATLSYASATGLLTVDLKHGGPELLHFTGLSSAAAFRFDGVQDGLRAIVLTHH